MAEPSYSKSIQFAGLVEAATAAADKEIDRPRGDGVQGAALPLGGGGSNLRRSIGSTGRSPGQYENGLRDSPNGEVAENEAHQPTRKRRRGESRSSGGEIVAQKEAIDQSAPSDSSPDRHSVGMNSAAALFRTPSTTSKKCTRPPMSRLFSSLRLPPEEFLHLQSGAKAYMLAEDHPERRDCVGQRGKTDSDMVKLRLWNCVQDFLDREGNGEIFYGVNARRVNDGLGTQSMTWPDHAQQIIKTCIPLFRRMVTNERQRQYAVETRKSVGEGKRGDSDQVENSWEVGRSKTLIDEVDDATTSASTRMSLRDEGLVSNGTESSAWYDAYNSSGVLDRIERKSGFSRALFVRMVFMIDEHCRFYHGDYGPRCHEECTSHMVEQIVELPTQRQARPVADISGTAQEVFDIVLAHLVGIQYWNRRVDGDGTVPGTTDTAPVRHRLQTEHRADSAKELPHGAPTDSSLTTNTTTTTSSSSSFANGQSSKTPAQLQIHVVRQNKCLLPPISLSSTKCANIEILKQQVLTHHGPRALRDKGVISVVDLSLKVWLPDGLVTIRNDGQWMVALLSADTVEWMDGQIRVLLEVEP